MNIGARVVAQFIHCCRQNASCNYQFYGNVQLCHALKSDCRSGHFHRGNQKILITGFIPAMLKYRDASCKYEKQKRADVKHKAEHVIVVHNFLSATCPNMRDPKWDRNNKTDTELCYFLLFVVPFYLQSVPVHSANCV
jgi:hypothetical protein